MENSWSLSAREIRALLNIWAYENMQWLLYLQYILYRYYIDIIYANSHFQGVYALPLLPLCLL